MNSIPLYAQSPETLPLNEADKRLILGQLYELRSCRDEVMTYREFVNRDSEQDLREKLLMEKALDLAGKELDLQKRETELQKDRAQTWETLYKAVTKKPGFGCKFLRIITAGIHRCQ